MPSTSAAKKRNTWLHRISRWLRIKPQATDSRSVDPLHVMTLEDRRLLAGNVTSVDVTTPSSDLVTDEDVGSNTFVVEVNFDAAMTPDNFSGDPGSAGARLLFSNGGGALPGLANGGGATLTNPSTVWSNGDMTATITFDVTDQNVSIPNIAIDVEGVVDDALDPQNPYTPNANDFSVDTESTAVSIDAALVAQNEGSAAPGVTTYTFTVSRDNGAGNLSVDYTVAGFGVNAANAADFDTGELTGTAQFTGNNLTTQITVDVLQDTTVEATEQFRVTLLDNASIVITQGIGTGQITNDDTANLTIADITPNEGASGTTTFTFTVTLDAMVDADVSVNYQTVAGTATAGTDYTTTNGTATISGALTQTFTVDVSGDALVELNETFLVNLSGLNANGRNVTLADTQAQATITNDDSANLTIADITPTEGNSGTAAVTFTVTLDAMVDADVSINYQTANGTATAGSDYTSTNGTATISSGGLTQTFSVTIAGDVLVELDETVLVNLSGLNANGRDVTLADTQGQATITNDDSADLTIDDISAVETDSGTTTFTFTLTLDGMVDADVSVNYQTANGTATAGADYATTNGTATISGALTQTFTVDVTGEELVELDETFLVNLSGLNANGRNVTLADAQGQATITNDDAANITIADITPNEGDSGTTTFTFTLTLDALVDADVSVNYQTVAGTATAGTDYTTTNGTATISGALTQTFTVDVAGEEVVELDETFLVNLSGLNANGRDVTLADTQAQATITNDDSANLTIADITPNEGNSGTTTFTFTLTLDALVDADVSVNYQTVAGTATAGTDYTTTNGTATISGALTQTFSVDVSGDALVELDETFLVNLSGFDANGRDVTLADAQAQATITNDDQANLTIGDVAVIEGDSGNATLTFTMTLDAMVDADVTINYATADGTADGTDYTALNSSATFSGVLTQEFDVTISGDELVELDETFLVNLTGLNANGRNVVVSDAQGQGTITNDDAANLTISDFTAAEGDSGTTSFTFTLTLDAFVDTDVSVNYLTANGTATAGSDFTSANSSATVSGGALTQQFMISVAGDETVELDENFFVNLSGLNAGGRDVTLADSQGEGTITNEDAANLVINDISVAEGNAGSTLFTFTLTLDALVDTDVSVNYQTADGTATAGSDFTGANSTATISGALTETFSINVTGEQTVELDENFLVNLSGLTAGGRDVTLTDAQGQATIQNDDSANLTINDISMAEGNSGTTNFIFTVSLSALVDADVSVNFQTADNGAAAGDDYAANSGTTTLSGVQTATITIAVSGDVEVEPDELFFVNLSGLTAAGRDVTLLDAQGLGTIQNDDSANITINDVTMAEGNAGLTAFTFTVSLNSSANADVTVNFATANNGAIAGQDYQAAAGTATITAGNTSDTITVNVLTDLVVEQDQQFFVNLSGLNANGLNISLADAQGLGQINNDDTANITVSQVAAVTEGDVDRDGNPLNTNATFSLSADATIEFNFSVGITTADGVGGSGATVLGEDYAPNSDTVLFVAGTQTFDRDFTVSIIGDLRMEGTETFQVVLGPFSSPPPNALIAVNATGVVNEDDTATSIRLDNAGNVIITDETEAGKADNVVIERNALEYVIRDAGGPLGKVIGPVNLINATEARINLPLTTAVQVFGAAGVDSVAVRGGGLLDAVYTPVASGVGTVSAAGQTITLNSLEQIGLSSLNSVTFQAGATGGNVTVTEGPLFTQPGNALRINESGGAFDSSTVAVRGADQLRIVATADVNVNIQANTSHMNDNLLIDLQGAGSLVNITGTVAFDDDVIIDTPTITAAPPVTHIRADQLALSTLSGANLRMDVDRVAVSNVGANLVRLVNDGGPMAIGAVGALNGVTTRVNGTQPGRLIEIIGPITFDPGSSVDVIDTSGPGDVLHARVGTLLSNASLMVNSPVQANQGFVPIDITSYGDFGNQQHELEIDWCLSGMCSPADVTGDLLTTLALPNMIVGGEQFQTDNTYIRNPTGVDSSDFEVGVTLRGPENIFFDTDFNPATDENSVRRLVLVNVSSLAPVPFIPDAIGNFEIVVAAVLSIEGVSDETVDVSVESRELEGAAGQTAASTELQYVLRLVLRTSENGEFKELKDEETDIKLDERDLDIVELAKRLPDGRYRIYLKRNESEEFVRDFIVRGREPFEASRGEIGEPIESDSDLGRGRIEDARPDAEPDEAIQDEAAMLNAKPNTPPLTRLDGRQHQLDGDALRLLGRHGALAGLAVGAAAVALAGAANDCQDDEDDGLQQIGAKGLASAFRRGRP